MPKGISTKQHELWYKIGNPKMDNLAILKSADSPYTKAKALAAARDLLDKNPSWRVWVQHAQTGERIFESDSEIAHQLQIAHQLRTGINVLHAPVVRMRTTPRA